MPPRAVGMRLAVAALVAFLVIAAFAVAVFEVFSEREQILGEAERTTANLARTLEEHSRITFEAVLYSLRSTGDHLSDLPRPWRVGDPGIREKLKHVVEAVPYLFDIRIVDENGVFVASVSDDSMLGKNVSDRPAFRRLKENPEIGVTVSKAENNPGYGGWVVFVTAPLKGRDGNFRGAAIGALDVNYFNRFYRALNVGKMGAIKLIRRDGIILTRWPEAYIGKDVSKGGLFTKHLPKSPMGSVQGVAETDGMARILSYRALSNLPLVVVVSASKDEILAPWVNRASIIALSAIALLLPVVALLYLLLRATRFQAAESRERRRLENQLLNAIDHVNEGVALFDPDDRLVVCNGTYRQQWSGGGPLALGIPFEDILRMNIETRRLEIPALEEEQWIADRMARHRDPGPSFECMCGGRWCLVHENKLPDGSTIQVTPDITDIKQREQEWRTAMQAAEQANAAKTRFLESANHDLRQPLQALNLMSHALAKQASGGRAAGIADNMRLAISAMESVLNSLGDIGKFESGRIMARNADFPLSKLFERLRAEFGMQAQNCGLDLRVVDSSLTVRSDFDLLSRIIENFLSNSIRYTEEGRILLGIRRRGDSVRVEVWDTGIGIPKDQLDYVFEEFVQLKNPARNRTKGLGLGLSIVQRIARLMDVEIDVRSDASKGSMFAVTVPLGAAETVVEPEPSALPETAELSGSILLIEDDASVLEATRLVLEDFGANVTCALSGEDAIGLIRDDGFQPDFILSDLRLPGEENGVMLVKHLRELIGSSVPGLIITGDTSDKQIREVRNAGFAVLRKPVDPDQLRDYVGFALAG